MNRAGGVSAGAECGTVVAAGVAQSSAVTSNRVTQLGELLVRQAQSLLRIDC